MPVKVWEVRGSELVSRVESDRRTVWTPEQLRPEAEELDKTLDAVLDRAIDRVERESTSSIPAEFVRAWAMGRGLTESEVLETSAMRAEQPHLLWKALASKCRTGARHDGTIDDRWRDLRPKRMSEPRREGGKLDYFEMCRWLAEQKLDDAADTFGGQIRNVWQMLERPTLRPLVLRQVLLEWIRELSPGERDRIYERDVFAELMKKLRRRWPDRGPGSAKRPIHYGRDELKEELDRTLHDFAAVA